jgi:hypothetical protein
MNINDAQAQTIESLTARVVALELAEGNTPESAETQE